MDRIAQLCAYLDKCSTFADVACDHGYCAEYMLKNGLCESALISDISEKSLSKAQTLLAQYIESGKCRAVLCDGLEKIEGADCVMIAGIGGEEIVKILKNSYIPQTFVFQPMKNASALRKYLLDNGCQITLDDIFTDGKNYYFIIKGNRLGNNQNYTQAEMIYGKDSLKNSVFFDYLSTEISKTQSYLKREMTEENRKLLKSKIDFMRGIIVNEIK